MKTKTLSHILAKLENVKRGANGWTALCPAHGDTRSSLSVAEGDDGRILLHCFAGCAVEEIAAALNITVADLFADSPRANRNSNATEAAPEYARGLSLEDYATAKRLPADFLRDLGVREIHLNGIKTVGIPYKCADGTEAALRFRVSLDGDQRFRWRNGSKPMLYGLWKLDKALKVRYVCLVEGESDAQTLWHNNFAAFGLPGAATWREEWAEFFEGFDEIYVVIEPDRGGEAVLNWLRRSKIRSRVSIVRLRGAKDVSELFLKSPENFPAAWRQALAEAEPWAEFERAEIEARAKHLWAKCKKLASREDILEEFAHVLFERGLAGEKAKAKLIYLALTSRLLDRIVSIGPKGASSAGKSYLILRVLEFFPQSAYYQLTAMSDKALAYSEEPIAHRFLVLYEAAALGGDWVSYFVRSLLSEGRLIYETIEKTSEGLKPRRIEREGPTGLIVTTTAIALHPENETRFISIQIDDTPEQTARILRSEAAEASRRRAENSEEIEELLAPWLALQEWIAATNNRVVIPYARAIAELVPPAAVRLRRDFKSVLSLVMAHALLHKATRKRDDQGRIIATLGDYESVRELVHPWIAEGAERAVSKKIRETVAAVKDIRSRKDSSLRADSSLTASVTEIARELKLDRSATYRRIRQAIERGFLQNLERIEKGRAMKIAVGEPMPDDESLLPRVEKIIAHMKEQRAR